MRTVGILAALLLSVTMYGQEATIFELEPNQSMSMTGQNPGQNGALNPYEGEDCKAIVKNIGDNVLGIRVKDKYDVVTITPIEPNETITIVLFKGSILYFDSERNAKVSLTFTKI